MPRYELRISTKAAIGPLPVPVRDSTLPLSISSTLRFTSSSRFEDCENPLRVKRPHPEFSEGKYSSANTFQSSAGETSPPCSSVLDCTTWLNSICSRRGRSRWYSFFIKYATPPLPDWLLTRITASYERPISLGSIGR